MFCPPFLKNISLILDQQSNFNNLEISNQLFVSLHNASPGSSLLTKTFNGSNLNKLIKDMEVCYDKVKIYKPGSSRQESSELFLLAQNMKIIKKSS